LLKKQGLAPKRIITDTLRSYGAARRQVIPAVEHRSHKGLNNRAENSHLPFRKRERTGQGFRSIGSLQQLSRSSQPSETISFPPNQIAPLPRSDPSAKPRLPNGGWPRCKSPEIQLAASMRPHVKQCDSTGP
jgi:putative transposase